MSKRSREEDGGNDLRGTSGRTARARKLLELVRRRSLYFSRSPLNAVQDVIGHSTLQFEKPKRCQHSLGSRLMRSGAVLFGEPIRLWWVLFGA